MTCIPTNKALSIRQPWVWSILYGGKDVENRTWYTNYRGPLLIHASTRFDQIEIQMVRLVFHHTGREPDAVPYPSQFAKDDPKRPYPTGGIVGVVDLVDCAWGHSSPWYIGKEVENERGKVKKNYAFVLANPRPIPFVGCQGALGIFEVKAKVMHQLEMAEAA